MLTDPCLHVSLSMCVFNSDHYVRRRRGLGREGQRQEEDICWRNTGVVQTQLYVWIFQNENIKKKSSLILLMREFRALGIHKNRVCILPTTMWRVSFMFILSFSVCLSFDPLLTNWQRYYHVAAWTSFLLGCYPTRAWLGLSQWWQHIRPSDNSYTLISSCQPPVGHCSSSGKFESLSLRTRNQCWGAAFMFTLLVISFLQSYHHAHIDFILRQLCVQGVTCDPNSADGWPY